MKLSFNKTKMRRISQRIFSHLDRALSGLKHEKIALSISGGLDSRALLESFARWEKRHDFDVLVIHANHQTREESSKEADAIFARALVLGFEAKIVTVFAGSKRDEATLRNLRYDSIGRELQKAGIRVLCTAHQMDDNAEGIFMDMFGFGGGRHGSAMQSIRNSHFGYVVRPFLGIERKELLLFLTSIGVKDYFRDPSNFDGSSARQSAREFLNQQAIRFHSNPVGRLSHVANRYLEERELLDLVQPENKENFRLKSNTSLAGLRNWLKQRYSQLCPELDPRNAAVGINAIVLKVRTKNLISGSGVDPAVNSITLEGALEWKFDLPGAKALVTPELVSLFRNYSVEVVE